MQNINIQYIYLHLQMQIYILSDKIQTWPTETCHPRHDQQSRTIISWMYWRICGLWGTLTDFPSLHLIHPISLNLTLALNELVMPLAIIQWMVTLILCVEGVRSEIICTEDFPVVGNAEIGSTMTKRHCICYNISHVICLWHLSGKKKSKHFYLRTLWILLIQILMLLNLLLAFHFINAHSARDTALMVSGPMTRNNELNIFVSLHQIWVSWSWHSVKWTADVSVM